MRLKNNDLRLGQHLINNIQHKTERPADLSPKIEETARLIDNNITLSRIYNMEDEEFLSIILN